MAVKKTIFPLRQPTINYSKVHNWLADVALPELSGNGFKTLYFIYRRTVGNRKPGGLEISNKQLLDGLGFGSFTTVQDAIDELTGSSTKKKGNSAKRVYLIVTKRGHWDKVQYQVNQDLLAEYLATESVASDNVSYGIQGAQIKADSQFPDDRFALSDATESVAIDESGSRTDATESGVHYENRSATENVVAYYENCSDDATKTVAKTESVATESVDIKRKKNKETKKEEKKPRLLSHKPDLLKPQIREVFEYWREQISPDSKWSELRERKIRGRLQDHFTVEQLKLAIDACKYSDFHMGKNTQKTKYNDIELICRDIEHTERFLSMPRGSQSSRNGVPEGYMLAADGVTVCKRPAL